MGNPVSDQNYGVSLAHDMESNCLLAVAIRYNSAADKLTSGEHTPRVNLPEAGSVLDLLIPLGMKG